MYLDMNMYLMVNNLINTITASNYKIIICKLIFTIDIFDISKFKKQPVNIAPLQ